MLGAGFDCRAHRLDALRPVTIYEVDRHDTQAVKRAAFARGASHPDVRFTYVHRGLLDRTMTFHGGEQLMANARNLGEPWTFGLYPSDVEAFLTPFRLKLIEDLGADDYRARYGLDQTGYRFYRVATATVG